MFLYIPSASVLIATVYLAISGDLKPDGDISGAGKMIFLVAALLMLFLFGVLFSSARRSNGYAALHDLAVNARVVRRSMLLAQPKPNLGGVDLGDADSSDKVGQYSVIQHLPTDACAEMCLAYDTRLLRRVWIRRKPESTTETPVSQRDLSRPGRLRWIGSEADEHGSYDVYEALTGRPFVSVVTEPHDWESVRYWLADIATELDAAERDGTQPSTLALNRVWITAEGRAKLLDFPAPGVREGVGMVSDSPKSFLLCLAAAALVGDLHAKINADGSVGVPMPARAIDVLNQARTADLSVTSKALRETGESAPISRTRRTAMSLASLIRFVVFVGPAIAAVAIGAQKAAVAAGGPAPNPWRATGSISSCQQSCPHGGWRSWFLAWYWH